MTTKPCPVCKFLIPRTALACAKCGHRLGNPLPEDMTSQAQPAATSVFNQSSSRGSYTIFIISGLVVVAVVGGVLWLNVFTSRKNPEKSLDSKLQAQPAASRSDERTRPEDVGKSQSSTNTTQAVEQPKPAGQLKPAKIEWAYLNRGKLTQRDGVMYYRLGDGFVADVPDDGNRDSTIHVYIPEQYRRSGQHAATAAALATCDVDKVIGSKSINVVGQVVQGYQFKLKSGTDLLVVPTNRTLKSVVMVQTLPGREPIISIGEVQP